MPYDEMSSIGGLADIEPGGQDMQMPAEGGPDMSMDTQPTGQQPTGQPPGGPGIDTPQEQQAIQLLMQGAQAFRQAASVEPSIGYIIDNHLQAAFLEITRHYGMEEEGKVALKRAKGERDRTQAAKISGPPAPPIA
uniref:Uncharacterized protein n=1 Tax=viral metagenome TaxID=1070528 RepID=A0A6M3J541_9ZZZZ